MLKLATVCCSDPLRSTYPYRMADVLDSNLVYVDPSGVRTALYVRYATALSDRMDGLFHRGYTSEERQMLPLGNT